MFLHGGLLHLIMNMMSLWSVATYLEETLGKAKTLALYLLLGATASAFSLWWHTRAGGIGNSVGASGAICGLIGVAVGFSMRHRNAARHLQSHYVGWAIWIAIIGFSGMRIDNAGHVGGLIPGFLLGLVVRRRRDTGHLAHRLWIAGAIIALAGTIACFVLMANSPLTHEQLFGSDEDETADEVDNATRAAILEARKTFESDDDYMPQSHVVLYTHPREDGKHDGQLEGRMRRLFGEPHDAVWKLKDRATGTQLRIFEGDDAFQVDGPAADTAVAHLTDLLQRTQPADFHVIWYDAGHAIDQRMSRGVLDERELSYDEALQSIDREIARASSADERAWILNDALHFYTGTVGHDADKPRFIAYLRELQHLNVDRYGDKLAGYAQALGIKP